VFSVLAVFDFIAEKHPALCLLLNLREEGLTELVANLFQQMNTTSQAASSDSGQQGSFVTVPARDLTECNILVACHSFTQARDAKRDLSHWASLVFLLSYVPEFNAQGWVAGAHASADDGLALQGVGGPGLQRVADTPAFFWDMHTEGVQGFALDLSAVVTRQSGDDASTDRMREHVRALLSSFVRASVGHFMPVFVWAADDLR